jgi:hypothetical protein
MADSMQVSEETVGAAKLQGRFVLDDREPLRDPGDYKVIWKDGEPVALAFIPPLGGWTPFQPLEAPDAKG